jgi:hypothetical protein
LIWGVNWVCAQAGEAINASSSNFFIGRTHGTRFPDPLGSSAASLVQLGWMQMLNI